MPKCDYCGQTPFLTFCASFFAHVERCRKRETLLIEKINQERQREQLLRKELQHQQELSAKLTHILCAEREKKITPRIQNNIYIQTVVCGDQINVKNLYMDYPKTPYFVGMIDFVEGYNVDTITDLETDIVARFRDDKHELNEFYHMLHTDPSNLKTSHLYSFISDVIRRLREKMEKRPYPNTRLIEQAKTMEKGYLESKAQLQV